MAQYQNLIATGAIKKGPGKLRGLLVNSTSSGTIRLYDDPGAANGPIGGVLTPAAGQFMNFGDDGIDFSKGIWAVITGTLDVTAVYN